MTTKFYDHTLSGDQHDIDSALECARHLCWSEIEVSETDPRGCELVETVGGVGVWRCRVTGDYGFSDESQVFVIFEDGQTYPLDADTLEGALIEAVESTRGNYPGVTSTTWIDVKVGHSGADSNELSTETVTIEPAEPDCEDGHEHDWKDTSVVNNGGGVICEEKCSHCGTVMITNTWAQRADTGEQGLRSVSYRDDDDSDSEDTDNDY